MAARGAADAGPAPGTDDESESRDVATSLLPGGGRCWLAASDGSLPGSALRFWVAGCGTAYFVSISFPAFVICNRYSWPQCMITT
jgi:hypothetical protein